MECSTEALALSPCLEDTKTCWAQPCWEDLVAVVLHRASLEPGDQRRLLHSASTSVTLHWLHPHLWVGKCCVQNRGTINRETSADLYWRNHHLNLASWQTLITGKLLRRININMGCLRFSKCWDIPQDPAAHPERAAGRERPRAASMDCRDLCFSSCPTTNPE